ncbi:diguanylate cyclase [Bacillaceae bacterium W0354]
MNTYKEELTKNYLESNYNYAKKLTTTTKDQLKYMQKNIIALGKMASHNGFDQGGLDTWYAANSEQFNSIFTTDENGVVKLISPAVIQYQGGTKVVAGTKLDSETIKNAIEEKKPIISEPYRGTSGQIIMLISAPIFDHTTGDYEGLIGGTIYLESENVLKSILGNHEYGNDSYVYVIDQNGMLIYHPDSERLGEDVTNNKIVQQLLNKKSGSMIAHNSKGIEYFAGYVYEESTGWGIVSQTPTDVIKTPIKHLSRETIILSIPFVFIILIIGSVIVSQITKPINTLARFSEDAIKDKNTFTDVELLTIKSRVYEVKQLYSQVIDHFRILNKQIQIDGLTEIANRKTFDTVISAWIKEDIPFSLIMLDIDFFKKVNDTHGHLVGDEVLKYLAKTMSDITSKDDLCFRYGGEEFGILVKGENEDEAYKLAEKLRETFAHSDNPSGDDITISLGVTAYQENDQHPKTIIERADAALYHSKRTGRNKTTVSEWIE